MQTHTLLFFLFHGVGGDHIINVSLQIHSGLLHFLKQKEKGIWIAPMIHVAKFIKSKQQGGYHQKVIWQKLFGRYRKDRFRF